MKHLILRTTIAVAALVTSSSAWAERVLVFDDTDTSIDARTAAERLGFEADRAANVAQFERKLRDEGPWDVVVIELKSLTIPTTTITLLQTYLSDGGLLSMAYFNLDTSAPLRALLDLTCTGDSANGAYVSTPDGSTDIFRWDAEVPSPLTPNAGSGDVGDYCTPVTAGQILARGGSVTGPPVIVTALDNQVIYNAIAPDLFRGRDQDTDGVPDFSELYQNQLVFLLESRPAALLAYAPAPVAFLEAWADRYDGNVEYVATAEALALVVAEDEYSAIYVEPGDGADGADVLAALEGARNAGLPTIFSSDNLDAADPDLLTALGVDSDGDQLAAPSLTAASGLLGRLAFSQPDLVEPALTFVAGRADFGDRLTASTPTITLAQFGGDASGAAAVAFAERRLTVAGFALSSLVSGDNTLIFFNNLLRLTSSLGPVALVLSDSEAPFDSPLYTEAGRVGYLPVVATSTTEALLGLQDAPAAVLLEDATGDLWNETDAEAFLSALQALPSAPGLFYMGTGLSNSTTLAGILGVVIETSLAAPTAVSQVRSHLGRLFSTPEAAPASLPVRGPGANSLVLAASSGFVGAPFATWSDGSPAGLTIQPASGAQPSWTSVNGFNVATFIGSDADGDRRDDLTEFIRNQLAALLNPPSVLFISDSAIADSVLYRAALYTGLRPRPFSALDTSEALTAANGSDLQVVIELAESAGAFDGAALTSLAAWQSSRRGMVVSIPDLSASPDLAAALGVVVSRNLPAAQQLVPGSVSPDQIFFTPVEVPYPLPMQAPGAEPVDYGDELTAAAATAAIRWRSSLGPIAAVYTADGTALVNAFRAALLADSDDDGDGVSDRVQLFVNQLVRTGRVPVALVDAPERFEEGTFVNLDASASYDPFGETLTFTWDFDADGSYDDATGATVRFDGTRVNGDGTESIPLSVRVRNASGLVATYSFSMIADNVAPTVEAGSDRNVNQGTLASFTVSIADVLGDTFPRVEWDFGDGESAFGETVSHQYDVVGAYVVTVTVEDSDGAVATDTFTVNYVNVAPSIEIGTYPPTDEGSEVTFTATGSDPGNDPFEVRWTFGDGDTATGASVQHTFRDNGSFTVTATAVELADVAVTRSDSATVQVRNLPPQIDNEPPGEAVDGEVYAWTVAVSDAGADAFTYRLTTAPVGMTVSAAGEVTWTPGGDGFGSRNATLVVRDDDGGEASVSWTMEILFDDTDNGGAPDSCELSFGYDVDDAADDQSDDDGDGLTLEQECFQNRDPSSFSGPPAPELVEPLGGVSVTFAAFDLVVANVDDPDGDTVTYEFELYSDEELATLVVAESDVAERAGAQTYIEITEPLTEDAQYWWRARGVGADTPGAWSEVGNFIFNLENSPPGRATANAPVGATNQLRPTFRVLNAVDPEGEILTYTIQVYEGTDLNAGTPLLNVTDISEGSGGITEFIPEIDFAEDTTYTWRVRATDTGRPRRTGPFDIATFRVDQSNGPPTTPEPFSPIDDAVVPLGESVTLAWNASSDPDNDPILYTVTCATDDAFEDVVAEAEVPQPVGAPRPSVILRFDLQPATTYHWRVQAADTTQVSDFAFARFVTAEVNVAPPSPVLISPGTAEEVEVASDAPVVTFRMGNVDDENVNDTITYHIQVAQRADMRDLVLNADTVAEGADAQTTYEGTLDLTEGFSGQLFWRARAFDGTARSAWSPVTGFSVVSTGPTNSDAGADGSDSDASPDAGVDGGTDEGSASGDDGGCTAVPGSPRSGGLFFLAMAVFVLVSRRRTVASAA